MEIAPAKTIFMTLALWSRAGTNCDHADWVSSGFRKKDSGEKFRKLTRCARGGESQANTAMTLITCGSDGTIRSNKVTYQTKGFPFDPFAD